MHGDTYLIWEPRATRPLSLSCCAAALYAMYKFKPHDCSWRQNTHRTSDDERVKRNNTEFTETIFILWWGDGSPPHTLLSLCQKHINGKYIPPVVYLIILFIQKRDYWMQLIYLPPVRFTCWMFHYIFRENQVWSAHTERTTDIMLVID